MCKVLLIDPFCKNPKYESPNIKLAYIGGILEKNGIEVTVKDFLLKEIEDIRNVEDYKYKRQKFFDELSKLSIDTDIVYINCEYGLLKTCVEISEKLSEKCKVIVGGTFINYLYTSRELIKCKRLPFDYISIGEPEVDVINICQKRNIYAKEYIGKALVFCSKMNNNLDALPFPRWDMFDLSKYDGGLYLLASKSCKYNRCYFCDERLIWGNSFRYRTVENIIAEIEQDVKKYNVNSFFFWDASILSYPFLEKLCEQIIEKKLKISWTALVRADEVNERIVELMKKAGCVSIEIGIESLNEYMLKKVNKGEKIEDIIRAIEILKKYEIIIEGSFVVGFPGETVESARTTIKEAIKLGLDYYRWHNFQVPVRFYLENNILFEGVWEELDLNYPNQFLHKVIENNIGGYMDMHIVSKMGNNRPTNYPDITVGNLTIKQIHDLTFEAIKESEKIMLREGHNPYI